jgi:hypothetical protein
MIFDSTPNAGGLYYFPGCGLKPKYPSLWKDCVFASGPLGNEGFRLRDFTGRTPGATWSVGAGDVPKYARGSENGQAFLTGHFDGIDDSLIIPSSVNSAIPSQFTFSAWIKPTLDMSSAGTDQIIVAKYTDDITGFRGGFLWKFDRDSSKKIQLACWNDTGTLVANTFGANTTWEAGRWYHLAVSWNGAGYSHWLNGNLDLYTADADRFGSVAQTIQVGKLPAAASQPQSLAAQVAGIGMWSRVLTPNEIATIATHPLAAYEVEVPRYYLFGSTPAGNWSWLNHLRNSPYGVAQ